MPDVKPSIEIETISGVVANFDWKLVKQEITEKDITLTIKKDLLTYPAASESKVD